MIYEFDPIIYPRKIWITYDATPDELNEYFPTGDDLGNEYKEEKDYYGITYSAKRGSTNKGGVLIRFADNNEAMESWNMLHEAIHAAGLICQYVGIPADFGNDEAFAYLVTWIMKCCEQVKRIK